MPKSDLPTNQSNIFTLCSKGHPSLLLASASSDWPPDTQIFERQESKILLRNKTLKQTYIGFIRYKKRETVVLLKSDEGKELGYIWSSLAGRPHSFRPNEQRMPNQMGVPQGGSGECQS